MALKGIEAATTCHPLAIDCPAATPQPQLHPHITPSTAKPWARANEEVLVRLIRTRKNNEDDDIIIIQ